MSVDDWKNLLWTAIDLKLKCNGNHRGLATLLTQRHVTMLFIKPNLRYEIAFTKACAVLGAAYTVIHDPQLELQPSCTDIGRILCRMTDTIVVSGSSQQAVTEVADGASVPVLNCCSNSLCLVRTLADLMTLQMYYGQLKDLRIGWIGPPRALCNTYLCLFPLFGISFRFNCISSDGTLALSPIKLADAQILCFEGQPETNLPDTPEEAAYKSHIRLTSGSGEVHQVDTPEEAAYRVHVLVTTSHDDPTRTINLKLLKEAELNWTFMHSMPRTPVEVSDEVFFSRRNLVWECSENMIYIAMAMLLRSLESYEPTGSMPVFEGPT